MVAIIVGPVLAMFIAHVFAAALAAYSARGRHLRGGELALAVVLGLVIGGAVLMLQVVLQPGEAVSNGVAAVGIHTLG